MTKKIFLWLEFSCLFVLVPLAYFLSPVALPKIPLLLVFFAGCAWYLRKSPQFGKDGFVNGLRGNGKALRLIFMRALAVAVFCPAAVMIIDPSLLFAFPRARPWFWLLVMVLYPVLSAYPQELIYRAFLFKRYGPVMSAGALIMASTLSFAFLHIIFHNWLAVALTIPAGYFFAKTYAGTGSLMAAALEHALYGCIAFTSGLGRFFYNPS